MPKQIFKNKFKIINKYMYLLIVFFPLIGAISSGLFGRFLGSTGSQIITTFGLFLSMLFSWYAFFEVSVCGNFVYIDLFLWIDCEMLQASWGCQFDTLTTLMLVTVTTVSCMVHIYSTGYMEQDPHIPRFMSYLSLFTFFMLMLVTADNFIQMFFGWEGVGLCSYLLISFWYTRIQANKAALKAMIVNRVGDFSLALGICAIFLVYQSVDYATVFSITPFIAGETFNLLGFEVEKLTFICLLLFGGAIGKSAQIGLHTWLPDAMEGPTPVSALIHAATMVTAGIFLVARCSPMFEYSPTALILVTIFGAMTAFFAATTGLVQNDLKRVIAYSTCSQLGYMAFACGLSNYSVGIFHLMNHGFFKALLFLSAGAVIHAVSDEQDMRKMGGLAKLIPFTYCMIVIGSLALMGFPFLTGFYSKDIIIEVAYAKYTLSGHFAHWFGCMAAFFTAFYSFRLVYLTFIVKTMGSRTIMEHAHEVPLSMGIPLIILSFGSIFLGFLTKDMVIGLGTDFWQNSVFVLPKNNLFVESEFIPTYIKLIPTILSFTGAILALVINHFYNNELYSFTTSNFGLILYSFLNKKWYFDKIYNEYINKKLLLFGYFVSFKGIDKGIVEMFGPYGIAITFISLANRFSKIQTGFIYHYAFVMLIGIILLLTSLTLWDNLQTYIFFDNRLLFIVLIAIIFNYNKEQRNIFILK
jgi:proton-translocating NADH-quinone oxidoreductase chain L